MGWKHFWLKGEHRKFSDKHNYYCVNSYGALNGLCPRYESVWLTCEEVLEILKSKTKKEKYDLCDKFFNEKFPQTKKEQKELSKEEQSKLEKLFP